MRNDVRGAIQIQDTDNNQNLSFVETDVKGKWNVIENGAYTGAVLYYRDRLGIENNPNQPIGISSKVLEAVHAIIGEYYMPREDLTIV